MGIFENIFWYVCDLRFYKLQIKNVSVNEILGVTIDRELKFDKHVKHICKKKVISSVYISKSMFTS